MKRIIMVEGKPMIAQEIKINPNAPEPKQAHLSPEMLFKLHEALKMRCENCMNNFAKAVEKDKICYIDTIGEDMPRNYTWSDSNNNWHHFSIPAYEAMQKGIERLDKVNMAMDCDLYTVFGEWEPMEIIQMVKAATEFIASPSLVHGLVDTMASILMRPRV